MADSCAQLAINTVPALGQITLTLDATYDYNAVVSLTGPSGTVLTCFLSPGDDCDVSNLPVGEYCAELVVDEIECFGEPLTKKTCFYLTGNTCENEPQPLFQVIEEPCKSGNALGIIEIRPSVTGSCARSELNVISLSNGEVGVPNFVNGGTIITGYRLPFRAGRNCFEVLPNPNSECPDCYGIYCFDSQVEPEDNEFEIVLEEIEQACKWYILKFDWILSRRRGFIDISINGSDDSEYTYQWSNGSTQQDLRGASPGYHCVKVTHACGGTQEKCFYVPCDPPPRDEIIILSDEDDNEGPCEFCFTTTGTGSNNRTYGGSSSGSSTGISYQLINNGIIHSDPRYIGRQFRTDLAGNTSYTISTSDKSYSYIVTETDTSIVTYEKIIDQITYNDKDYFIAEKADVGIGIYNDDYTTQLSSQHEHQDLYAHGSRIYVASLEDENTLLVKQYTQDLTYLANINQATFAQPVQGVSIVINDTTTYGLIAFDNHVDLIRFNHSTTEAYTIITTIVGNLKPLDLKITKQGTLVMSALFEDSINLQGYGNITSNGGFDIIHIAVSTEGLIEAVHQDGGAGDDFLTGTTIKKNHLYYSYVFKDSTKNQGQVMHEDYETQFGNSIIDFYDFTILEERDITQLPSPELSIVPNPAQGSVTLSLSLLYAKDNRAVFYNTTGQEVMSKVLLEDTNIIDISTLDGGLYIIQVQGYATTKIYVID